MHRDAETADVQEPWRRWHTSTHEILAVWGDEGTPFSRRPANSGPSSFAALVNVESRVLRDSKTKMMLVTANRPCPTVLVTAEGCPVNTPLYKLSGTLPKPDNQVRRCQSLLDNP